MNVNMSRFILVLMETSAFIFQDSVVVIILFYDI